MRVKEAVFCDACGEEINDGDFVITMNYGSEDDCYGCGGNNERVLYDKFGKTKKWNNVRGYLGQDGWDTCAECRNGGNFITRFEREAREARSSLILKLAKERKIPDLCDPTEVEKKLRAKLEKEKDDLFEAVKKEPSNAKADEMIERIIEVKKKLDRLKSKYD